MRLKKVITIAKDYSSTQQNFPSVYGVPTSWHQIQLPIVSRLIFNRISKLKQAYTVVHLSHGFGQELT